MKLRIAFLLCGTAAFLLGFADAALAWGPGVHMAVADAVLARFDLLPLLTAEALRNHRECFLYGSLSADIFIGKGSSLKKHHSHNWSTGFALLDSARTAQLRAYALGYLSHLAADTVAHNFYVPNMLAASPSKGRMGHVWSEMLADHHTQWDAPLAARLMTRPRRAADDILLAAMHRRKLPFLLKKRMYWGSLRLCRGQGWRRSVDILDRLLPEAWAEHCLDMMYDLSLRVVWNFLQAPERSPALALDPIGSRNLEASRRLGQRQTRHAGGPFTPCFQADESLTSLPPLPLTPEASPIAAAS